MVCRPGVFGVVVPRRNTDEKVVVTLEVICAPSPREGAHICLRAPEAARERSLADWVAFAWTRLAGRAALLTNIVLARLVDEDIAAGLR